MNALPSSSSTVVDDRAGQLDPAPFCLVYRDVIMSPEFLALPRASLLLYLLIGTYTGGGMTSRNHGGRAGPTAKMWRISIPRLEAETRLSRASVFGGLKKLKAAGLLTTRGTRTSSWFILHDPAGQGKRREVVPPLHSDKHSRKTWLGVPGIRVRVEDGSPVGTPRFCAGVVRQWEGIQGKAVSCELFKTLGFDPMDHPEYLAAYDARYSEGSNNLDPLEGSKSLDGGRSSESEGSKFLDPLETNLVNDDQKNQSIPSGDGHALEGPIDNPSFQESDKDRISQLLIEVKQATGVLRSIGPMTRKRVIAIALTHQLSVRALDRWEQLLPEFTDCPPGEIMKSLASAAAPEELREQQAGGDPDPLLAWVGDVLPATR